MNTASLLPRFCIGYKVYSKSARGFRITSKWKSLTVSAPNLNSALAQAQRLIPTGAEIGTFWPI